jgi:hypothetical protein
MFVVPFQTQYVFNTAVIMAAIATAFENPQLSEQPTKSLGLRTLDPQSLQFVKFE